MLALSLLMVVPFATGKNAEKAADYDTSIWRYEVSQLSLAKQGTAQLAVWSYSKTPSVAAAQACKNAVHAIIYKGVPAGGNGSSAIAPFVDIVNISAESKSFLNNFFRDGGEYMGYVSVSGNGIAGQTSVMKVSKTEYKVGTTVIVNTTLLRQALEKAGVIRGLNSAFESGGKKPTLMVVPSDAWCFERGYYTEYDNMGTMERIPDYKKALSSDMEMALVITKMGELMADAGFPLKDLAATMKSLESDAVEMQHMAVADGGIAESSLDKLRATAKADIWMSVGYIYNKGNMNSSVTFILQGLDAYTNKQVAGASGEGSASGFAPANLLLLSSVVSHMPAFQNQLNMHFADLEKNGREVTLNCMVTNFSSVNFDSDMGDDILSFIIEDWLAANTQGGRFNTVDATENVLKFDQVRIPMVGENGRAVDTRRWAYNLTRELKSKYKVSSTVGMKGLGGAYIIVNGTTE